MGTVLLIIAQNGFRDEELFDTKEVLENKGHTCTVASITTNTATGKLGKTTKPDIALKDVQINDYDFIAVIGGPGALELANHEEFNDLLSQAKEHNKTMGAICIAPALLAKAGILDGKKATVYKTEESIQILKDNNAEFIDENVVVDGPIITGNGPHAAKEFGEKIAKHLE